jgi:predicted DNA-binding protein
MVTQRLEIRLDPERQRKLATLVQKNGSPVSELVRGMIDDAYEGVMLQRRLEIVRRIAEAEIEDVPDPVTLSRQLDEAHDPGIP